MANSDGGDGRSLPLPIQMAAVSNIEFPFHEAVEEAKHGRDIERLEKALASHAAALRGQMGGVTETVGRNSGRIDALEAVRNRQEGMGQMALWLHKFGPWAIAAVAAALAWAGFPTRG